MQLSVKTNLKEVQAMFRQFPGQVRAAAVAALNKTARSTKTQMYKRIRQRRTLNVSASEIKSMLHVFYAFTRRLTAGVSISGKPISLSHFKIKKQRTGILANVINEGYRGPVSKYGNKAFTNPGLGGGTAVFVRQTSKRLPLSKVFGPSLPSAITAKGWEISELQPKMAETWMHNIVNQLQWRLKRFASTPKV